MSRNVLFVIGIVLTVLGAVLLWQGGIPYTEREQVLDIGPVEATAETRETVTVPPIVSGLVLAAGVGVLVVGVARKSG